MQTAVMEKLQQQMMANIEKVSPEALMQSWFTFDPKIAERFQDMFVTMAGLGGTRHGRQEIMPPDDSANAGAAGFARRASACCWPRCGGYSNSTPACCCRRC